MTLKWMADRLTMGTWTHVANRLNHLKKQTCVNAQGSFMYRRRKVNRNGQSI
jgi:hypothetical protein